MSGGHWNNLFIQFEDQADNIEEGRMSAVLAFRVLAELEHRLDYGICADTCLECAKIAVIEGLKRYFDIASGSDYHYRTERRDDAPYDPPLQIVKQAMRDAPWCPKCEERRSKVETPRPSI